MLECPHLGVLVARSRILASVGGVLRIPVPGKPILSSTSTSWEGFALEQHYTPSFMEFPQNIKFPGYLIAMNLCEEAPLMVYRAEGGGEKQTRLPDGSVSMLSSQEIVAARQYGASMVFPLAIEDLTMERVCQDVPGNRRVEWVARPDVDDPTLHHLMSALVEDLRAGCPAGRIFGESLVNAVAAYTAHKYAVFSCRFPEYRDGLPARRLKDVLDYIHSNLGSNLSVAEIARVARISPYHFGKLFKRSTGQTLHQYVLAQRILRAEVLLATTDLGLAQIALTIGLTNQSHFTTLFKQKEGVPPGRYRSQFRFHTPG